MRLNSFYRVLTQTYYPPIHFQSFVLVEPMLITCGHDRIYGKSDILVTGALRRRDVWPSREAALEAFNSRPSWKAWDEEVLKLYVVR